MKKTIILLLFLISLGCGSYKKKKIEPKITEKKKKENYINSQDYIITLPSYWRAIFSHGYMNYTPTKIGENFHNNKVYILSPKLNESLTLKKFVKKHTKKENRKENISSQTMVKEQSRFGEIYIHNYKKYNGLYKYKEIFLQHDGKFYMFKYSSESSLFKIYLNDVNSIFKSLKFKN